MKRMILPLTIAALLISTIANAQYGRWGMRGRYGAGPRQRGENLPPYKPTLDISIGYGFPNVDRVYLPDYFGAYRGSISQSGPITGSVDYQFNRRMSVGVMVTHGSVKAPYYDFNSGDKLFNSKLDNWSFMFDFVRYMPVSRVVTPYFRTAIGFNAWKETHKDDGGNEVTSVEPADLPPLAYQAGIGAKFFLAKNAGLFIEAGYGKYILHGGLTVKF